MYISKTTNQPSNQPIKELIYIYIHIHTYVIHLSVILVHFFAYGVRPVYNKCVVDIIKMCFTRLQNYV
jgi:hypothetical protein